ncbi:MAG: hypothetical protein JSW61_14310 [Candidatus Thorarchaeota archaeon]|nr:MAG: hypothetical protein JSW61_14310 [Candidatus Thorarchaeota archaeon]
MRQGLVRCIVLVCLLAACVPVNSAGPVREASAHETQSVSNATALPSSTFSPEATWDSLFSSINTDNIRQIVRVLSEDYPMRVWIPEQNFPTNALVRAWDYVNNTILGYTSGETYFRFHSEYQTLVAVKNGTQSYRSPILLVGTVSSRWAPGANYFGGSVAAVLEAARILHPLNLTNDVYFVLVNTITERYRGYLLVPGNLAIEALLDSMAAQQVVPSALFWFSTMLYENNEDYGDAVVLSTGHEEAPYDSHEFIRDLSQWSSQASGQSRIFAVDQPGDLWTMSGAYEASIRGIPGISFTQSYFDPWTGSDEDYWDVPDWEYDKVREAVGVASCVAAFLGQVGNGEVPSFSVSGSMNPGENITWSVPLTGNSIVNVTVDLVSDVLINVNLFSPLGALVNDSTETATRIALSHLVTTPGMFTILVVNLDNVSVSGTVSFQHWQDFDQDTLDDWEEFVHGTDSLSADSDMDYLDDADEITLGTSPIDPDSDDDGAWDGVEILWGSDPLIEDSDNDGVGDGTEISLGMDPTSSDSDNDGLLDPEELILGTNPLSNDTDGDGLLDIYEVTLGTNPNNTDTDGDGLSDLFEILNGLNALVNDTDGDGLDDLYEIENNLLPFDVDSDSDGIPDGEDVAPREHWMYMIPVVGLGASGVLLVIWLFVKWRAYYRSDLM